MPPSTWKQWGMAIRDEDDEFVGAEFRDEETRLLFAYDYDTRTTLRVQGADVKVYLYREMKRLGITILDRVMATSLLTEGGKAGGRVVGATGAERAHGRVLRAARPRRPCSPPASRCASGSSTPNWPGFAHGARRPQLRRRRLRHRLEGGGGVHAHGAEHADAPGRFRYPAYGTGNSSNTWYGCTIVDANGKEIPYVDSDGNVLKTVVGTVPPQARQGPGSPRSPIWPNASGAASSSFPSTPTCPPCRSTSAGPSSGSWCATRARPASRSTRPTPRPVSTPTRTCSRPTSTPRR